MDEFLKPKCRPGFITAAILFLMTGTLFMGCGGPAAWIAGGTIWFGILFTFDIVCWAIGRFQRRAYTERAIRAAFADSQPADGDLQQEEQQLCRA